MRVPAMNPQNSQWEQLELAMPVHRGLSKPFDKQYNTGIHWSTDPDIAKELSGLGRDSQEHYYKPRHTDVLHGEMPLSSIETDKSTLRKLVVLGVDNPKENTEKEVTAKYKAPIRVTGISRIKETPLLDKDTGKEVPYKGRKREIRYNPPREMQA